MMLAAAIMNIMNGTPANISINATMYVFFTTGGRTGGSRLNAPPVRGDVWHSCSAQREQPGARITVSQSLHALISTVPLVWLTFINYVRWATRHRSGLERRSSTLEFKLHRQRYLQLLEAGQVQESIAYARKNFGYFGSRHIEGNIELFEHIDTAV